MIIIKHKNNRDVCYSINKYDFTSKGLEVFEYQIYNISGKISFPIHLKGNLDKFLISKEKFDNWLKMTMENIKPDFKQNEWNSLGDEYAISIRQLS